MRVVLPDVEATRRLGVTLGTRAFPGAVICLHGDLGAGKTSLAQGIAQGLGVIGHVPSPTFILVAEYPDARVPFRHADLYRVEGAEVETLGLAERVGEDGVWVVEWAERWDGWPEERLDIELEYDEAGRVATFHPHGHRHALLLGPVDG